jgi:hypothetical protein
MISAHLAAEMDLASRLDRKLQEVSAKLEAQKSSETSASASQGAGMSESGKSSESAAETELSVVKLNGGEGKLFAKMEWDVLMGKEVIL